MEKSIEACINEGALSEIENSIVYKEREIYENHTKNLISQNIPVAIILGGQIASGKSTLGQKFRKEYETKGGIATIDGDALRDYHPKFEEYNKDNDKFMAAYTANDSVKWTEKLIDDTANDRYNMIIETTLLHRRNVTEMVEKLIKLDYEVMAKIFVVSYDKSLLGIYDRYETLKGERGSGRFVFDQALKTACSCLPKTLKALKKQGHCSSIHLYTREGVLFNGNYKDTDIVAIVKSELCREYSQEEINFLQNGWQDVKAKMLTRKANKDEYIEIANRMLDRINQMIANKVSAKNIDTMNDIYNNWLLD
jgi:deoxyadenosine/deoxycytidine kinase